MARINIKPDYRTKDTVRLYLRFKHNTKEKLFSLNLSFPIKYWNKKKNTFQNETEISNIYQTKKFLTALVEKCESKLIEHRTNEDASFESVAHAIGEIINRTKLNSNFDSVLNQFQHFYKDKEREVKPITLQKYKTLEKHLYDFSKDVLKTELTFGHFNKGFELDFKHFLSDKHSMLNNTMSKQIECLKIFLRYCQENELFNSSQYQKYSTARDNHDDVIALNRDDLKRLIELDLREQNDLDYIRDMFVFMSLTGQRISDYLNLEWEHIQDHGTIKEWSLYQTKGNKPQRISVPIFSYALTVLDKLDKVKTSSLVFNGYKEQTINKKIKKIAELAGLDRHHHIVRYSLKKRIEKGARICDLISCHTSRKTFSSILANSNISDDQIRSITGHADNKVLQVYKATFAEERNRKMEKVFNF